MVLGLWAGVADAQDKPVLGGSATISGTVTFTDGKPVVNRPVEWRPNGDPNGGSTVQTDASGAYTIQGLKDGEYFVGYFQPDRLPADRNQDVEVAPDATSAELSAIGRPLIRRVQIKQGQSVKGIDFVITNIGDERVEGPESGNANAIQPGLPNTGSAAAGSDGGRKAMTWTLAAAAVIGLLGVAAFAMLNAVRRRV